MIGGGHVEVIDKRIVFVQCRTGAGEGSRDAGDRVFKEILGL